VALVAAAVLELQSRVVQLRKLVQVELVMVLLAVLQQQEQQQQVVVVQEQLVLMVLPCLLVMAVLVEILGHLGYQLLV
jgi:hypothetical protein